MSQRPEWPDDGDDDAGDVELPEYGDGGDQRATSATGQERPSTPLTQQIGRIAVLILLGVFVVFAVSNSQAVDFSWVFGETEVRQDPATGETSGGVPLIVLLLLAFAVGALVGAAVVRMLKRRRTRATERGAG